MGREKPSGSIVWIDLTVKDAGRLRDFYRDVVGWEPEGVGMGDYEDYNMVSKATGEPVAGVCHARGPNANLPAQWLVYVQVEDVEASVRRAVELGGAVVDGPRSMGGAQSFAVIRDPAGAVLAIIGSKR